MLVVVGDSLSDIAKSNFVENGEDDNDEETEQLKLSEDDESGWMMCTISQSVRQQMESCRPKQMKLDKLTQPEWGDAADYIHERDKK
jgi:hypothetical protein